MKTDDKIALAAEIAMFTLSTECAGSILLRGSEDAVANQLDNLIKSVYKTLDDLDEDN